MTKTPATGAERWPVRQGHGLLGDTVIAFPLAAGAVYPFPLSPEVAALSISGSLAAAALAPPALPI